MDSQRTGGMTAIGVLNIIFGSLGTLLCLLMVVGGGLLAAGGAAMEAELGAEAEGLGATAATGGAIVVLIGLAGAVAWILMFVGGIGVLKVASWGCKMSLIGAVCVALLNLVSLFTGGFGITNVLMIGYCVTVVALFMKPEWKAAFSGQAGPVGSLESDQQFRSAA